MPGIFEVKFKLVTDDRDCSEDEVTVAAETATEAIAKATRYFSADAYTSVELLEVKLKERSLL